MKHYTFLFISLIIFPAYVYTQCDYSYGKWDTTLSKMPVDRALFSAVTYNDSIYILGGFRINNEGTREYISSVDIYIPATDTWISGITDLPFARLCTYACLLDNKIYVMGGAQIVGEDPVTYDSLNIYDIQTNTWEKGKSLPAKRGYFGADTIKGKIYLTGGLTDNWIVEKSMYVYDPVLDEWTEKASMNATRYGTCAKSCNGKLYVSGGISGTWEVQKSIEAYDPESDQWTLLTNEPAPRASMDVSLVGDYLFAIGGFQAFSGSGYIYKDIISRYDPSSDSWLNFLQQEDKIPNERLYPASIFINDKIYLFGGSKDGVTFDNVWSYSLKSIRQTKEFKDTVISSESIEINLSDYFSTTEDEAMNFNICPGYNEAVIDPRLENSTLIIEKLGAAGESTELAVNVFDALDTVSSNTFIISFPPLELQNHPMNQLSVYPNPVHELLTIEHPDYLNETIAAKIMDMSGRIIWTQKIEKSVTSIDVSSFEEGIYFLQIAGKGINQVQKIVKR